MFLELSLRDAPPPQICCGPSGIGVRHIHSEGRLLSGEVDDLVMYLIVTCNDKTYVAVYERMMHQKGLHETTTFILEVRGVNVMMRTLKIEKFCFGY